MIDSAGYISRVIILAVFFFCWWYIVVEAMLCQIASQYDKPFTRYWHLTLTWSKQNYPIRWHQTKTADLMPWCRPDGKKWAQAPTARDTNSDSDDDVIKWKHFPRYWPFVSGIHRSPVNSPHKASDAVLWCCLWSASEQTVEQTIKTQVMWDAIEIVTTSL